MMIDNKGLKNIFKNRKVLIQEAGFAYVYPSKELENLISNFTISFPKETVISNDYTVMPHGSVTLVFFEYNTETYSFVFGPTTHPIKVGNMANKCDVIFIIEFQPAGFYPFTKMNQSELTDEIFPFSSINNSLDTKMKNIFKNALTIDELLCNFEKELTQNKPFKYPIELGDAIQKIIQEEGVITSKDISKNIFYSTRHINRLFNQYLGMSIKSFSRLVRINKAIKLLNNQTSSLAFLCESLGYYDVSHFIKDFKAVCHVTPQQYKDNMSDFYSEIAKF